MSGVTDETTRLKALIFDLGEEKKKIAKDLETELLAKKEKAEEVANLTKLLEESEEKEKHLVERCKNLRIEQSERDLEAREREEMLIKDCKDLRKELREKEEKLGSEKAELKGYLKLFQEREDNLKKDLAASKSSQVKYQENLKEIQEILDKVQQERDLLIMERGQTTSLFRKLADLIQMEYSEQDVQSSDLVAFLERVVNGTKEVLETAENKVAGCKDLLQKFDSLYAGTRSWRDFGSALPAAASVGRVQNMDSDEEMATNTNTAADDPSPPSPQPTCSKYSTRYQRALSSNSNSPAGRLLRGALTRKSGRPSVRHVNEFKQRTSFARTSGDHGRVTNGGKGTAMSPCQCKCGLAFVGKASLRVHINKMTKEWRYYCKPCQWYFFFPCDLERHQKSQDCVNKRRASGGLELIRRVKKRTAARLSSAQQRERPERPLRERSERPQRERSERPQRERSERPQRERSERPERERFERPERERFERPERERSERPQSEGSERPQSEGSERPQSEGSERPQSERPERPQRERKPPVRYAGASSSTSSDSSESSSESSSDSDDSDDSSDGNLVFSCKDCNGRYAQVRSLKRHLENDHGQVDALKGLYGCRKCGKLFRALGALRFHRKVEHDEVAHPSASGRQLHSESVLRTPTRSADDLTDSIVAEAVGPTMMQDEDGAATVPMEEEEDVKPVIAIDDNSAKNIPE